MGIMNKPQQTPVEWYKSLSLHQRINLKIITVDACGMAWQDFNILFTPRERLKIVYQKLKIEGIV